MGGEEMKNCKICGQQPVSKVNKGRLYRYMCPDFIKHKTAVRDEKKPYKKCRFQFTCWCNTPREAELEWNENN